MMEAAQPKLPTEEQLLEMGKMFPNLDKDIISSVFVEKSGSQEEVINVLLQMSSEWMMNLSVSCFVFACKGFFIRFDFISPILHNTCIIRDCMIFQIFILQLFEHLHDFQI